MARIRLILLVLVLNIASVARAAIKDLPNLFVGKIQAIANDETPFGVTDGNPSAATAFFAHDAFDYFALAPLLSASAQSDPRAVELGFRADAGGIEGQVVSSSFVEASPAFGVQLSDRIGFVMSLPLQWRQTASADAYFGGVNLGFPITIRRPTNSQHFGWQLTPFANTGVGASSDLAQGGWLYGGGLASSVTFRAGNLQFTLGNQFSWTGGTPIGYPSQFDYKQNVSQPILKNGLRADYSFDRIVPYAAVTYTNLLHEAYTQNYWTPEIGVGWQITDHTRLSFGYIGEFGDQYNSNGGQASFVIDF